MREDAGAVIGLAAIVSAAFALDAQTAVEAGLALASRARQSVATPPKAAPFVDTTPPACRVLGEDEMPADEVLEAVFEDDVDHEGESR